MLDSAISEEYTWKESVEEIEGKFTVKASRMEKFILISYQLRTYFYVQKLINNSWRLVSDFLEETSPESQDDSIIEQI